MKPKTLILMVVAVVCGLGASYMTSRLLAEREDKPAQIVQREPEKVKLLAAKKELIMHQYIKTPQELFDWKEFVVDNVPKEALADFNALKGKTLKRLLHKGEVVLPEDLNDGSPVLEVPPGFQAMGLSVNVHTSAGGFASLPGSRVDIIWSKRGQTDQTSFTKTLLQNVLVLAADGAKNRTEDGTPIVASVVTLALTPEDVRRVANAAESGTMRLVLRIPGDNTIVKNDMTSLDETIRGGPAPKEGEEGGAEMVGVSPLEERGPLVVQALPNVGRTPRQGVDGQPIREVPQIGEAPAQIGEAPEARKYRRHVVQFRQGDKQWKEVFLLDEQGRVVDADDVARLEAPPQQPQQPAVVAPQTLPKDR